MMSPAPSHSPVGSVWQGKIRCNGLQRVLSSIVTAVRPGLLWINWCRVAWFIRRPALPGARRKRREQEPKARLAMIENGHDEPRFNESDKFGRRSLRRT